MRVSGNVLLVLGVAAFLAVPVLAKRDAAGIDPAELLLNKSVQQELKLSDADVARARQAVAKVQEKHQQEFARLKAAKPNERKRPLKELEIAVSEEVHKALTEALKPEQAKRLRQIETQQNYKKIGPGVFLHSRHRSSLKLSNEQNEKIMAIRDEYKAERAKLTDQDALEKLLKESTDKVLAILTDEQKNMWQDLVGEPFDLKLEKPRKKPKK